MRQVFLELLQVLLDHHDKVLVDRVLVDRVDMDMEDMVGMVVVGMAGSMVADKALEPVRDSNLVSDDILMHSFGEVKLIHSHPYVQVLCFEE
jgi:hypothetical protein